MDQHHRSEVKDAGQRYFNNQFAEYSNQPLTDQSQYMDQALGLMQDIYTYYTSNPSRKRRDLYTGGAGIAYACVRLLQHLPDDNQDRENIQRLCANIIDSILTEHRATLGRDKSLMNGDAGVWMAAALVYAELDRMTDAEKALKEYVGCCAGVERMTLTGSSGDELFTGRCGFLVGFLELWKRFPEHSCRLRELSEPYWRLDESIVICGDSIR